MRRVCFLSFVGLCVAVVPVMGQIPDLQHFRCYPVLKLDPEVRAEVELLDQFDTPEVVEVLRAKRFCNPTAKFLPGTPFTPVTDRRQHLTFYATFPQQGPLRIADVENQFGPQQLLLREPIALAAPTQKLRPTEHSFPEGLDHFRCYAAWGQRIDRNVGLRDQFMGLNRHFVLNPVLFCNPSQKLNLDTGEVTPIQNPDQHLTCYSIRRVPFEGEAFVFNQFGDQAFALGSPDMLCVPTRKEDWFLVETGPIPGAD